MKYIYKISIKQQLSSILIVAITAFILINSTVSNLIGAIVMRKNIEYTEIIADKFSQEIEYIKEKAVSIFNFLQFSDVVQSYFVQEKQSNYYEIYSEIERYLTNIKMIYPELDDIVLIGKHHNRSVLKDYDLEQILQQFSDQKPVSYVGILEQTDVTNVTLKYKTMIYISTIYSSTVGEGYLQKVGQCVLSIQFTGINSGNFDSNNDTDFLILDRNLDYYPINCSDETAKQILKYISKDTIEHTIDNREILLKSYPVDDNLYVISFTDKKALLKDMKYIQTLIILVGFISVLVLVGIIILIYRNVVTPIYCLSRHMRDITDENFVHIQQKIVITGNKEMIELADTLNTMLSEFDRRTHSLLSTTNHLYEMEIEKKIAEISFLKSQINPHFLYNSLETIKGICMKNNLPEAAGIANSLGKMFRYSIKGADIVKFREELDIAKAYIEIQKARFAHKVDNIFNISKETLDIPVIKMILQPIIENVFEHVVEKTTSKTTIYISSFRSDDSLIITVQDDGIGMDREKLDYLNQVLRTDQIFNTSHIGIANVGMRIRLLYGEGYGMEVESTQGEGTKVTIRIAITEMDF